MKQYPIRALSELTGVSATTLRAWERRYGLLKPARTPKGHRLYSAKDIDLVNKIVSLLNSGLTISQAVKQLDRPDAEPVSSDIEAHWANMQYRMLKAVQHFDQARLDRAYSDALALYPVDTVNDQLLQPVIKAIGGQQADHQLAIAEQLFFYAYLRSKLGARLQHVSNQARGNKLLIAGLPGDFDEIGILLFASVLVGYGYQVTYLGINVPLDALPQVTQRAGASALLLFGSAALRLDPSLQQQLSSCTTRLDRPCLVGGELSTQYHDQLTALNALPLGADYGPAMQLMQQHVPAFSK